MTKKTNEKFLKTVRLIMKEYKDEPRDAKKILYGYLLALEDNKELTRVEVNQLTDMIHHAIK